MPIPYDILAEGTQDLLREIFGQFITLDVTDNGWLEACLPRTRDENLVLKVGQDRMTALYLQNRMVGLGIPTHFEFLPDQRTSPKSGVPVFRIYLSELSGHAEELNAMLFPPIDFAKRLEKRKSAEPKAPVRNATGETARMSLRSLRPEARQLLDEYFGAANVLRCETQGGNRMVILRMPRNETDFVGTTSRTAVEIERRLDELEVDCEQSTSSDGELSRYLAIDAEQLAGALHDIRDYLSLLPDADVTRLKPGAARKQPMAGQPLSTKATPSARFPMFEDLSPRTQRLVSGLFSRQAVINDLERDAQGDLSVKVSLPAGLDHAAPFRGTGSSFADILTHLADEGIPARIEARIGGQQLLIPVDPLERRLDALSARLRLPTALIPKPRPYNERRNRQAEPFLPGLLPRGEEAMTEGMFGQGDRPRPDNVIQGPFAGRGKLESGEPEKEQGRQ